MNANSPLATSRRVVQVGVITPAQLAANRNAANGPPLG
jgi:hypothetical protein